MRVEYFKTFIEVVEKGGFLRAARELGVTQATVSNHIATLEKFFGVTLFDRSRRIVRLTKEGEILLKRAKEILELVDKTRDELRKIGEEEEGRIRLVASTIPGEHILPNLVAQFKEKNPRISFEIEVLDTGGALKKLLRGEADLAAVGSLTEESVKEIEAIPIGRERLVFICPVNHELAMKKKVTLEDCLRYPFVFRERTSGTRLEAERALMRLGIPLDKVKVSLEAGSTEAVINAVSVGLGITILSETAAKKAEVAGLVKIIEVEGWDVERMLYLVRDKRRKMPVVVKDFWKFASEKQRKESL